ncbi:osteoclast-stimulating factor 1-like [Lingula anatina]|uniref:Osteoclast-stimulating factor 1 n=1 Tax=Lingula anatina TaxID=7574 RepID=A0A1S3K611_LINAN|nr:osteoclast-stimulating factor 1-like [Lingula anatina]XP_013417691.1 osteoclast-stimulating factor 1-like [Lingula anatina]|eukprot:XP_013405121.1 osteoclast-stimulating factor 1-like [Lingula anatina]
MSRPARPPPPPPTPKPGQVKVVRAMYRYEAQQTDELTFDEGDTLYILDMSDSGWWKARCGDKEGLIPSNYVEENTESIEHPLHEASRRGNISFLSECLKNRVSVNGLDKAGSTPLHWAAHGGHIDCLETLLKVPNVEVNVQNKLGDTPLHSAAWKGHPDAVTLLLEKNARADIKNNDGKKPYELAKDPETAALLKHAIIPRTFSTDYGDEDDSD